MFFELVTTVIRNRSVDFNDIYTAFRKHKKLVPYRRFLFNFHFLYTINCWSFPENMEKIC